MATETEVVLPPRRHPATGFSRSKTKPGAKYQTLHDARTGEDIHWIAGDQRWEDLPGNSQPIQDNAFGEMVIATITGNRDRLASEVSMAISENSGTLGGYNVHDQVASELVGQVRALELLSKTSSPTFLAGSNVLHIGTLESDPEFAQREEHQPFIESGMTFGMVTAVPRVVGTTIVISREWADDALNGPGLVQRETAKALAAHKDALAFSDGIKPHGLLAHDDIPSHAGATNWLGLAETYRDVRLENYTPDAIVTTVSNDHLLSVEQTTDGHWQGAPPHMQGLPVLSSTSVPADTTIVGDWAYFGTVLRNNIEVEWDRGGEAFQNHQIKLKVWQRYDHVLLRPTAFKVRTVA